jgi:hypothetical protein
MTGSFIQVWEYLWTDLWSPLADYSCDDAAAPQDLFSVLFVTANDYLSPEATAQELEENRNDPIKAQQRFQVLKGTDFTNEFAIVNFLEAVYDVIKDYEIPGFEDYYQKHLIETIRKFNLRYRVDDPFIVRFLLPGSFDNLYAELHRINLGNTHLVDLLSDFEKSFDDYTRTQNQTDLKTCIAKASNYAEGLASFTYGQNGTLGHLCGRLNDWPHDKMKEALINLYHFCSDYPGIRHAGNPHGVRRPLASRDVTLGCLLLISFTGYLSPLIDEQVVLGI